MKNLKIHDDGSYTIKNVPLSYEHCHKPWRKNANEQLAYSGTGILNKKTHKEEIAFLQGVINDLVKTQIKKPIPADKKFLRDGDQTEKPEYEGAFILVAREREDRPPVLLDRHKNRVTEKDDKIYSGAIVNIRFRPWVQMNEHGNRVNANLLGVQFMEHGEKFTTVPALDPDEAFDDEGGGDDGFD